RRVGSNKAIPIDVRIVAATNRNLEEEVKEGRFREDLFYRLNVLHIEIPPLRERRDDIPLLLDHFIDRYNEELNRKVLGVENQAVQTLMTYDWPGNVRELENAVERWMIVSSDQQLKQADLPPDIRESGGEDETLTDDLKQAVNAYEKQHIRRVLESVDDNRTEAAEKLGIDPSTLYRKLEKYDLDQ
ncbi:MAG: sigma 54-interacting transcriptional regulator, partial [bacterium]